MVDDLAHDPRLLWLLARVDKQCVEAVEELLRFIAEHLAIATSDAVTVRVLSEDRQSLLPLAAHHPEPMIASAMASIMSETTQPADSGLWLPVMQERKPRRWRMPRGYVPAEASEQQAAFLEKFPIRAVLGVPILLDDRLIGGVSVVRFAVDREFTDQDEALVVACASRIAPALEFRSRLKEAQ
ncbi:MULTISPECIES: GAF domain-containing protein [Nocardioides]|uniref:GAF domain-containing protein n=1 Tax=Nocardioides vastitatis TaxID=2568655 RepID=A0ABW0ZLC9_9ACTN|nr:GAF domain-containing protein [Nocardioides sp.]THJ06199.1 GAF domain-containing protein [Nocardioides sp.]